MYQFKMPKDVTASVKTIKDNEIKNENLNNFLKKVNTINKKYSSNHDPFVAPAKVELKRLNFNSKTKDEIKDEGIKSLEDFKNNSLMGINNSYKNKEYELKNSINPLKENAKLQAENINKLYNNAKEQTSNDAIKRGLAHSSIVVNQLNAFNNEELEEYNKLNKNLSNSINAINFKLEGLKQEKDNALNNFNVEYASKLNSKIKELEDDLKKEEQQVIKYNNEIAEKEQEYNNDIIKLKDNYDNANFNKDKFFMDMKIKYGGNILKSLRDMDVESEALNYFNSLDKNEALNILKNSDIKNSLGERVYNNILRRFQ